MQPLIMRRSWKALLLTLCLCVGILYINMPSVRRQLSGRHRIYRERSEKDPARKVSPKESKKNNPFIQKHILLLSQGRSGSSFASELFNQNPAMFYLFEPLYHVQQAFTNASITYRALNGAYRDILYQLYKCNLESLENYILPQPQNHMTSSLFRRSSSHALCSPPVCRSGEKERKAGKPDETWCHEKCKTLNLTLASEVCRTRSHVVIKTVRMPQIEDYQTLIEDPRLDLRIVHLVRDPRAILASRITAFVEDFQAWKIWNATGQQPPDVDLSQVIGLCDSMMHSIQVALQKPAWLKARYLLVRYEDLALNPEAKAYEIYRFLDMNIDSDVLVWLFKNTRSTTTNLYNEFSTSRNAKATPQSWRLRLNFSIVQAVQKFCSTTLASLGYRAVQSEVELRNMTISLLQEKTL